MIEVRTIQSMDEQRVICQTFGVRYDAGCLAYAAREGETGRLLGIVEFRLGDPGEIDYLACGDTSPEKPENIRFILGRTAMNFIDMCGVHAAVSKLSDDETSRALGFRPDDGGVWRADLGAIFAAPCQYKTSKAPKTPEN